MRPAPAALLLLAAACGAARPARAAEAPPVPAAAVPGAARAEADDLDAGRRRLADAMAAAAEAEAERRRAGEGLDALRADRARLAAELIATTARARAAEERASAGEERLAGFADRAGAVRASLAARRGETVEVLAALQRGGLHPPPALLASPGDALRAIRASMLLGAVVPELRAAAERLAGDLAELRRLRAAAETERDALRADLAALGADRARLSDLVAVRQAAERGAAADLEARGRRADDLAGQAGSLKALVDRLDGEAAVRREAAAARRRAVEADAAGVEARAAAATREPARLAPALPFADARGQLSPPVAGRPLRGFGAPDGFGGQERGLTIGTRAGAVVTAPADGQVVFAGPWRSYGALVILDLGGGYRLVLAGLARADVAPGQFVLAGEPLGAVGEGGAGGSAAIALGAGDPVLYVELRRDGAAIDPAPWWAKAEAQKVRG